MTDDQVKLWKQKYDRFYIYDLVSNYGIEKSLNCTEDCLTKLANEKIIDKIKEFIV